MLRLKKSEIRSGGKPLVVITPSEDDSANRWREIWRERELLYFLSWRDLLVRYKQTVVGIAWSILKPLATILVYSFVFGTLAQLPSHGVPYTLLVLTGLLPWLLFSTILIVTSESLIANAHPIQKIYFPQLVIPLSAVVVPVVDHLVAFLLVFVMLFWFGVAPGWQFLLLPLVMALAVASALGLGLGLNTAAANAHLRDCGS
jgi:lipopolysaccharide transport system permease protein